MIGITAPVTALAIMSILGRIHSRHYAYRASTYMPRTIEAQMPGETLYSMMASTRNGSQPCSGASRAAGRVMAQPRLVPSTGGVLLVVLLIIVGLLGLLPDRLGG